MASMSPFSLMTTPELRRVWNAAMSELAGEVRVRQFKRDK
jgi:hypothetical protein